MLICLQFLFTFAKSADWRWRWSGTCFSSFLVSCLGWDPQSQKTVQVSLIVLLLLKAFFWVFFTTHIFTDKKFVKLILRILMHYSNLESSMSFNLLELTIPWWLILVGFSKQFDILKIKVKRHSLYVDMLRVGFEIK